MGFFSHKPSADGSPCPQMRMLLSQLSDGTLKGIRLWYAERHTHQCPRCSGALVTMLALEVRIHAYVHQEAVSGEATASSAAALPPALRIQISEALDRIDAGTCKPDF